MLNCIPFGVYMIMNNTRKYLLTSIEDIKRVANSVISNTEDNILLNEERKYEITLVLNELLVNCFDYAKPSVQEPVILLTCLHDGRLSMRVTDNGQGFEYDNKKTSNYEKLVNEDTLYRERGRGLMLVKAFCQEVNYNEKGNSVEVKMVL